MFNYLMKKVLINFSPRIKLNELLIKSIISYNEDNNFNFLPANDLLSLTPIFNTNINKLIFTNNNHTVNVSYIITHKSDSSTSISFLFKSDLFDINFHHYMEYSHFIDEYCIINSYLDSESIIKMNLLLKSFNPTKEYDINSFLLFLILKRKYCTHYCANDYVLSGKILATNDLTLSLNYDNESNNWCILINNNVKILDTILLSSIKHNDIDDIIESIDIVLKKYNSCKK